MSEKDNELYDGSEVVPQEEEVKNPADITDEEGEENLIDSPRHSDESKLKGQRDYYKQQYEKLKSKQGNSTKSSPADIDYDTVSVMASYKDAEDRQKLSKIAELEGITVIEAEKSDMFKLYQESKNRKKASLPAARSVGKPVKDERDFASFMADAIADVVSK